MMTVWFFRRRMSFLSCELKIIFILILSDGLELRFRSRLCGITPYVIFDLDSCLPKGLFLGLILPYLLHYDYLPHQVSLQESVLYLGTPREGAKEYNLFSVRQGEMLLSRLCCRDNAVGALSAT